MKVLKNILDWLGISIFLALLCVVVLQIIARSVLTISIPWTEELSRFLYLADIHWRGNCGKKREQYRNRHADSEDPQ